MTVNRVCGSGAQAIVTAAQQIATGEVDAAIAGGMENMDRAPYLMDGGRWGYRMGPAEIHDSMLRDGLDDAFSGKHSGWHTEDLVTQAQLTREAQDRFAARSQQRFGSAQKAGKFKDEIVAVEIRGKKGIEAFAVDEAPRPDTTFEVLAKLRPAFREGGTITAGNAPGLNSGAAAMIVADRAFAETRSVEPMARLVAYGVAAVEPGMFGLGPVRPSARRWSGPDGSSRTWSASRSTKPSRPCRSPSRRNSACPRTSSMSKAAPLRMVIRSARPEPCSRRGSCTRCAATASAAAWSRSASAVVRALRWRSKGFRIRIRHILPFPAVIVFNRQVAGYDRWARDGARGHFVQQLRRP